MGITGEDIWTRIGRRAWQSRFHRLAPWAAHVPTMLTPEEGRMLSWIGEHAFTGQGVVLDLGCFIGGSTARLASGLARSNKPWTMHSFDRFEISEPLKQKYLYAAGHKRFEGTDAQPLFKHFLRDHLANIRMWSGDFKEHQYTGEKVEVMFVDIAKSSEVNDLLLSNYFPHLIPGQSVVIQQDYLHYRTPWLITSMELLYPKIQMVAWTKDYSVLFKCCDQITPDDAKNASFDALSEQQVVELMERAKARFPFEYQREMMDLSMRAYRAKPTARQAHAYPEMLPRRGAARA